ncbi:hypothetical protein [Methanoregula sp.]|uniref:hypothetical protein n=1 Tax=Methanoregula sp. TaxID=2052170 RepID=UPI002612754C|nr:hypothetical protein [Methanoregula sp.]MDD5142650.1 hypothetical protein [Methanoregula sp.]
MNHRSVLGLALCILFLLVFILILASGIAAGPVASPVTASAGDALWKGRAFEVILQGIMILSAVMSIILLLGPGRSRGGLS